MSQKIPNLDFIKDNEQLHAHFGAASMEASIHSLNIQKTSFWELYYLYEGCGVYHSSHEQLHVKAGQLVLIKPNTMYTLQSQAVDSGVPLRFCHICFTKAYMNLIQTAFIDIEGISSYTLSSIITNSDSFSCVIHDDNAKNLQHLMWMIAHEYNHFTVGSEWLIQHSLISLLLCITRLHEYQTAQKGPVVTTSSDIDELTKYIRTNYGSKLSLDSLASQMHLSKEYLCRYFKKITGAKISDYITEVRMEKAMEMLRTTSHSVADIGAYCGYSSISSFQRSFKKYTGVSPNEYRKGKGLS